MQMYMTENQAIRGRMILGRDKQGIKAVSSYVWNWFRHVLEPMKCIWWMQCLLQYNVTLGLSESKSPNATINSCESLPTELTDNSNNDYTRQECISILCLQQIE